MDKNILLSYFRNELAGKQALLENSALSDEEKAAIQAVIDNLNTTIEAVEAVEETEVANEAVEALKTTVAELDENVKAIMERINAAEDNREDNQEEETMTNYLKSKQAVADFAKCIRNSKNAEEFRNAWLENLKLQNDAATETVNIEAGSETAYMPQAVLGQINDIWGREASWLRDLNWTGAKKYYSRHNVSEQDAETSRAKGWKKGDKKVMQELTFDAKLIEPQVIYKLAVIDVKTKFDTDEALVTYLLNELVDQILYEIKRAILVGDGRQANDPYKISSFEILNKDTTDAYTTVTTASSTFLVEDVRIAMDTIKNPNGKKVIAFMTKSDLRTLAKVQASETSTPVFLSKEQVAEQIMVDEIVTTDLLTDGTVIGFIPGEYYCVGDSLLNPAMYSWHDGWYNQDCHRAEVICGGAINALQSSAVLIPA